jgi:hypothetical protein
MIMGMKRNSITAKKTQKFNRQDYSPHNGKIIKKFKLECRYLDEDDSWRVILSTTAFADLSTFHTTNQSNPGQHV